MMMKRPIFRSETLQEQFIRDGYATFKLKFPEALMAVRNEFPNLKPADNFKPVSNDNGHAVDMHITQYDIDNEYRMRVSNLFKQSFAREFDELLIDYQLLSGNFFVKNPKCDITDIHQHWTVADYEHTTLTCWIPLHDVDEQNGTLQVLEGSHKITPYVRTTSHEEYFALFKDEVFSHFKSVPLKFGEAVIFCETVLHAAFPNKSDEQRRAIQLSMHPKECNLYVNVENETTHQLDRYAFDEKLYLEMGPNVHSVLAKQEKIKSIPNTNRPLSYEEFKFRMSEGPAIREQLYKGEIPVARPFVQAAPAVEDSEPETGSGSPVKRLYTKMKRLLKFAD